MPLFTGNWLWTAGPMTARNAFVRFRRSFSPGEAPATIRITADSRYWLWLNGEWIGHGPVRAWTGHWRYDEYDLSPYLGAASNTLAVLVQHYGEGTFQYLDAPAGLLVELIDAAGRSLPEAGWVATPDPSYPSFVPRVSVQEGFEEWHEAAADDGWRLNGYDAGHWPAAVGLRSAEAGPHSDFGPRGIPNLTLEPVLPQRIVETCTVRSLPYICTTNLRRMLLPDDRTSNMVVCNAYLATQLLAPEPCRVRFTSPHKWVTATRVNGEDAVDGWADLRAGWNSVVHSVRGGHHLPEFSLCLDAPPGLSWSVTGREGGAPLALVGPFTMGPHEEGIAESHFDASRICTPALCSEATAEAGEAFWQTCDVSAVVAQPYCRAIPFEYLYPDVFTQSYTDTVTGVADLVDPEALLSGTGWATIPAGDEDVRILLDFGTMVVGYQSFRVSAPAGTVLDFHNFEFIQPDGRRNYAEGMNNSFRYTCAGGTAEYMTLQRRGFRYCYLTIRRRTGDVRLGEVRALFSSYPQRRVGSFACSDAQLDRIWSVGAHTLRCCAEDTYTDCPTYEQTNWVGDARNEALIDWAINGDPRLWFRCLEQTGQSLDRSPITESHVPSSWENLLPAWSFLWMRSCSEYLLFTGDRSGACELLGYIGRNVAGIRSHLNAQGLFDIRAWNMFDWAAMDQPNRGVVTHQNCLAVLALNDAASMAEVLGEASTAVEWRALALALKAAVNEHLWNSDKRAYTDCLRDGGHSPVYSQQTQTAALMSGVADGERGDRCFEMMETPPEGFVRAGSPFFEFFLLEAYRTRNRDREFLDLIRRDWGFMVDKGANTFWEMWSNPGERLTRSHCHGWSAAPTYFLSAHVAGIRPGGPGFTPVIVEPHPGDLAWCRCSMPVPGGVVSVEWHNPADGDFDLVISAPKDVNVKVRLPRAGRAVLNGNVITE